MIALLCAIAGVPGPALAQEYYPDGQQGDVVQVSSTHLQNLVDRIEALEASSSLDTWAGKDDGKKDSSSPGVTIKLFGRIHWDYWGFANESPLINTYETGNPTIKPSDRFAFRRVRIGAKGNIYHNMEYKIQLEFANPNSPTFKDIYLGWNELPILRTLLLGNQKRPYGLDHLNSSRYNVFMERPYIIEGNNQDSRRLGLCSYGLSDNQRWNWRYGAFLLSDISGSGQYTANAYQAEFAGRLANTIWYDESSGGRGYAHWAIAGSFADPNPAPGGTAVNEARFRSRPEARSLERWVNTGRIANVDTYQLVGLEGVLNLGAFSVVGEYQAVNVNRLNNATSLNFHGGYVYVAYWLTGESTPWSRKSGTLARTKPLEDFFLVRDCCGGHGFGLGAWQIAARYSHADYTDDNVFGGIADSLTIGLNWWWNDHARMQFNYINGSIRQGMAATDLGDPATVVFPAGGSGRYDIYGARFMIDF